MKGFAYLVPAIMLPIFALTATACRQIPSAPAAQAPAGPAKVRPASGAANPAWDSREPDTCKAAELRPLIGQPSGNLRQMRAPGPVRVVNPGLIVDQEEYDSTRINAYVDGEGVILRLSCG